MYWIWLLKIFYSNNSGGKKLQSTTLNAIQDGYFWGFSRKVGEGGRKKSPLPKICLTYPAIMKIGTVLTYPKKIQKLYESRDTALEFCWHQHFFSGNQQILLYSEILIAYWYIIFSSSNLFRVFKDFFNKYDLNFDDASKNGYSRPS